MTHIPGPNSYELMQPIRDHESRNVTFMSIEFPIAWDHASGSHVVDADGNQYIDLSAAFGVAAVGHANPRVAHAIAQQAATLGHAMGDVHPASIKARFLERLAAFSTIPDAKIFLSSTGSEAVEAAMKTAMLATGRSRFAACIGGYHGLSFGTLALTGIQKFYAPFQARIPNDTVRIPFGDLAAAYEQLRNRRDIAAVVIEPIQARGGCNVPSADYLPGLRALCDDIGALLILDEIYTGFGRTGYRFAFQGFGVDPDILCVGKAMGGGFPIAATIARREIMDAWPKSDGEALHTSTYLGNPMGCAAALAVIDELNGGLMQRATQIATIMQEHATRLMAHALVREVRGRGAMWGIELTSGANVQRVMLEALQRGIILLPCGVSGEVLSLTPPLVISDADFHHALMSIDTILTEQERQAT